MSGLWSLTRCWQPTPAGRHRLSVLGALNAVTQQLLTVTTDTHINSQHVCRMLYQLAALGLTVPITVVLDNARHQRCGLAQETAAHLNIELLFLPTYSPRFNLIERFWKLVKNAACMPAIIPRFQTSKNPFSTSSKPRMSRKKTC